MRSLPVILFVLAFIVPAKSQTMNNGLPWFTIEKLKYGEVVSVRTDKIPGLVLDLWCYEDALGNPVSHEYRGNVLLLHHVLGTAEVTTSFIPVKDGVDIRVSVSGPIEEDVKKVRSLNPCCQFERSPAFGSEEGHYVDDFVARCFVFLEDGLTYMKDTKRIPGTSTNDGEKANLKEPWIQEYYPVWRKHPGQIPGQRGYSTDRPVYPIVGTVSKDGKYLAAIAWPETMRLGQVWHHCVHPRPIIGESFNAEEQVINSHAKIYLMENNGKKLIRNFKKDFKEWKRPAGGM